MTDRSAVDAIETVWVDMPDGARLAARLWLPPEAKDGPVPAILEYIPYRRRDHTRIRDEGTHPYLARAGFASIRIDMRGSGDSDGLMEDEYSHQEMQDGHDAVQWIADQDWCDGNVGMFGKSWGAYTAFQVAALKPPALKAIAPVMGTDDRWLEDIHFYGGVLANDNFWWGSVMQERNALPPDPDIVGWDRWEAIWKERLDAMQFWPALWLEHQTHDEIWRRGSISESYGDVGIPVYFFGGWADLFRDTPFRIAEKLTGPLKVLMGPWAHLYPHQGSPGPKADFIDELVRFMDHHLRGKDSGLMDEPPLRFWVQDSFAPKGTQPERPGYWAEEASWPSPNVTDTALWLNAGSLDATAGDGAPMSICSPQTFGSAGGDMCSFAIAGDMPVDCRIDAAGALLFRTAPLEAPMEILGQPSIALKVAADRPQAFVAALLVDEAPDGAQTLITRGFCNLMHREGASAPTAVTPGEEMAVTVPLHGTAYRLATGHRLMVQIASAYWPVLWPSPEPVTLTLRPGTSALALPLRAAPDGAPEPRALPEPERPLVTTPITALRDGALAREITTDLTSGRLTHRFYIDGGVFGPVGLVRLDETGTAIGGVSERIYAIDPDDPLSARATMEQDAVLERGDWKVRIKTYSEQTATASEFHINAWVECWNGDSLFHRVDWSHKVPRNGM